MKGTASGRGGGCMVTRSFPVAKTFESKCAERRGALRQGRRRRWFRPIGARQGRQRTNERRRSRWLGRPQPPGLTNGTTIPRRVLVIMPDGIRSRRRRLSSSRWSAGPPVLVVRLVEAARRCWRMVTRMRWPWLKMMLVQPMCQASFAGLAWREEHLLFSNPFRPDNPRAPAG